MFALLAFSLSPIQIENFVHTLPVKESWSCEVNVTTAYCCTDGYEPKQIQTGWICSSENKIPETLPPLVVKNFGAEA